MENKTRLEKFLTFIFSRKFNDFLGIIQTILFVSLWMYGFFTPTNVYITECELDKFAIGEITNLNETLNWDGSTKIKTIPVNWTKLMEEGNYDIKKTKIFGNDEYITK